MAAASRHGCSNPGRLLSPMRGAKVLDAAVRPICFTAFGFLVAWEPVAAPELEHLRLQSLLSESQRTLIPKAGNHPPDLLYLLFIHLLLLSTICLYCLRLWLTL
jgi:hypothetical protein